MTSSILLFTFSPVQSFIAEARRAADLYTGSQILVQLAQKAGEVIRQHAKDKKLIYPTKLAADVPNKIVAQISWENCEMVAQEAQQAMLTHWKKLAREARETFEKETLLPFDPSIWERQIADDYLWEVYWSAASLEGRDYKAAYAEAEAGLVATKFTRLFTQPFTQKNSKKEIGEFGFKDTLSGKREALRNSRSGKEYWQAITQSNSDITPIKVRPNGRERLDALGIIKRFHPELAEKETAPFSGFPSTSSIASLDYLELIRSDIKNYREALTNLFGKKSRLMRVREVNKNIADEDIPTSKFPYDGDFLYMETLTLNRLQSDYGLSKANIENHLQGDSGAKTQLKKLQDKYGKPSPYYAIIKLDGDSMGKCLRDLDEQGHRDFSEKLSEFITKVKELASNSQYHACVIYNGGDDVLAMASLSKAVEFARDMTKEFKRIMAQWEVTASAGIVITHHLSPLSNALREVDKAEKKAKELDGKNAACVTVLRRSGETLQMVSKWDQVSKFPDFVKLFAEKELASKLPYDIAQASYALWNAGDLSAEDIKRLDDMSAAEIKRLVKRHGMPNIKEPDETKRQDLKNKWIVDRADELHMWAKNMPRQIEELANWLSLARFVAQGGRT
jgi:CRISPR-associated protein Cmr2